MISKINPLVITNALFSNSIEIDDKPMPRNAEPSMN
jgi:hypothetical protein